MGISIEIWRRRTRKLFSRNILRAPYWATWRGELFSARDRSAECPELKFACNGAPRRHFASTGQKNPFSRKFPTRKSGQEKKHSAILRLSGSAPQISSFVQSASTRDIPASLAGKPALSFLHPNLL